MNAVTRCYKYPLVNVYILLWKDPPFYSWVNQRTFDWAMASSSQTVNVRLPEAIAVLPRWDSARFFPTFCFECSVASAVCWSFWAVVDGPFGSEGQRLEKEVPMGFAKSHLQLMDVPQFVCLPLGMACWDHIFIYFHVSGWRSQFGRRNVKLGFNPKPAVELGYHF